jgi:hypothetical protein
MFLEAINLDPHLAIAHFQLGVSKFLLHEFEEALDSFSCALNVESHVPNLMD